VRLPDPSSSAAASRRMAGPPLSGIGTGLAEAEDVRLKSSCPGYPDGSAPAPEFVSQLLST